MGNHAGHQLPIRLQHYSYRFAEQVLNSRLHLKNEVEQVLTHSTLAFPALSRPGFNSALKNLFIDLGWESQPKVFDDDVDAYARMDFLKDRIGIEVGFGHASFLGIDLLKFQVASYSGLDKIDVGIYVTTTRRFQQHLTEVYNRNWEGSLTYEKVCRYLPHFKSAIQIPIYVLGIDA